jgi:hypothetical protein
VRQWVEVGLVQRQHLSVDGSFVEANAAKQSRIPGEQLGKAAQVNQTVRQYLQEEVEEQNPVEEPVHEQAQVSTTDPDSTYATKGGTPARLGYYDNYRVDNDGCVIVGVQATAARMSQETVTHPSRCAPCEDCEANRLAYAASHVRNTAESERRGRCDGASTHASRQRECHDGPLRPSCDAS